MSGEIEKRADAQLARQLARGPVNVPARLAGAGTVLTAAGVGLVAAGAGLAFPVLAIFYFLIAFGVGLMVGGAASWLRRRQRAREEPPVPPARLLPPG
jgi:predicted phage tail protein